MPDTLKIKIVYVLDSLGFGGREKVVFDLANGLCYEKFEVYILSFSNDSVAQAGLIKKNIKTICMPFKRSSLGGISALFFWMKGLIIYLSILRKIKPDIVHTHLLFQQFLFGSLGIRLSRVKAVHFHTVHTAGLYFANTSFINKARLFTEKIAVRINHTIIIAVSKIVKENCLEHFGKYASAIYYLPNGVDKKKFDPLLHSHVKKEDYGFQQQDILITYVARMDKGKDHLTLLNAWKKVIVLNPAGKLCLIGDGPLKDVLATFVNKNHLENSVIFLGYQSEVENILAITDIGVFTSVFEGFGIAVVEKMMMNIPVVGANIPTISAIIVDGTNGYLFMPGNSDELAEKLLILLNNPGLRKQMGIEAQKTALDFTIEETVKKHTEYYEVSTNH